MNIDATELTIHPSHKDVIDCKYQPPRYSNSKECLLCVKKQHVYNNAPSKEDGCAYNSLNQPCIVFDKRKLVIGGYETMTVGEMMVILAKFPQDVPILGHNGSDYQAFKITEDDYISEESKMLVFRQGQVQSTHPDAQWEDEIPCYVAAVTLF